MRHSTYQKLVITASSLFREKGYVATNVADILKAAGVPKGSLYHHFPGGKHDLAVAAAEWSSRQVLELIDEVFADTKRSDKSFLEGARDICMRSAAIFEERDRRNFSSVSSILLDDIKNDNFREMANDIYTNWKERFLHHADEFNVDQQEAAILADHMLILLEGAWVISRASGSSRPIRQVADFISLPTDVDQYYPKHLAQSDLTGGRPIVADAETH